MKTRNISRKLAAYSLAFTAGSAAYEAAEGAVVRYRPEHGPIILRQAPDYIGTWIDINDDGVDDFTLMAYFNFYIQGPVPDNKTLLEGSSLTMAAILAPGETIEPGVGSYSHFPRLDLFQGTRGYAAVVFDVPGGSLHYGYLDVEVAADGSSATFYGGAYESEPETAIIAGAIPEPTGLALLAHGAGSLLTRRRSMR